MGIRGLIGVKLDDNLVVGCQVFDDANPEKLGVDIIEFAKTLLYNNTLEIFTNNILKVNPVEYDITVPYNLLKYYTTLYNINIDRKEVRWFHLLDHIVDGVNIFKEILSGKLNHFKNDMDFFQHGPFCKYTYIINLNNITIEFYIGTGDTGDLYANSPCQLKGVLPISKNITNNDMFEIFTISNN